MFFAVIGVEVFNQYFSSQSGEDTVFSLNNNAAASRFLLVLGIFSFFSAFIVAVYLSIARGILVMLFAFIGFLAAAFYEGPPFKWSYKGLGEFFIFLAYGPAMTLGSYYVQVQSINLTVTLASLIPGLLIFSLAIVNEIPDYYKDKLIGKRNIAVRIGRKRAILLYQIVLLLSFIILGVGLLSKEFPILSSLLYITVPLAYISLSQARKNFEDPKAFILVIRYSLFLYILILSLFILSFLLG